MISVRLKTRFYADPQEPDDFVPHYTGDIELLGQDDWERIGHASAYVVNADNASEGGWGVFDALDARSQTAPYIELYNLEEAGNFAPKVLKILGEDFVFGHSMLILERLEVLPQHRGRGYGLLALRAMIDGLRSGCRIAALKPFPLQFEAGAKEKPEYRALGLGDLNPRKGESTKALRAYYGTLGFVHVPRTELMVLDLEKKLPDEDELRRRTKARQPQGLG